MSKTGRSDKNLFGGYTHYDEKGHKTGTSRENLFGGYTNYDANGHKTGTSRENLFGGYTHYDANGHKIGSSQENLFGGYRNYDASGNRTGSSDPNLTGGYSHSNSEGCYIATCVYGSYDCPQVWTLRRFRDQILRAHILGRAFVRCYYAVSPTLVRWFGENEGFRRLWQKGLDRMVSRLRERGISEAPYQDRSAASWEVGQNHGV